MLGGLFTPRKTLWRRLRYNSAENAVRALALIRKAGFTLELRWRAERADERLIHTLFIGGEARVVEAVAKMAGAFGLLMDEAQEPKPMPGLFVPGAWESTLESDADAQITPRGMYLRSSEKNAARLSREPGAEIALPEPDLGLTATPEMPYAPHDPEGSAWHIGSTGFGAPAGLVGDREAQLAFVEPLAVASCQNGRGTILLDGGDGRLALRLRQNPALTSVLRGGRLKELSLSKAGQMGFNPLADTGLDEEDALARWAWFWRGAGIYDRDHIRFAYDTGARSVIQALQTWESEPTMLASADAARRFMEGDQGVAGVWLSGKFDVIGHLEAGGHLLVECQQATNIPARQAALRGLLALAMQAQARLLSSGVRWADTDDAALAWLDALCLNRRWETTVFTRCGTDLAEKAVKWYSDPHLAEYLRTLQDGEALAHAGGEWWRLTN